MKRIFLFLLLVFFAFAQSSGATAIKGAMSELCNSARSLSATASILCLLPALLLLVVGAAAFKLYKGDNEKVRTAGKLALGAGIVMMVLAVLGIVLYLLTPPLISALTGVPTGSDPCSMG